VENAKGRIMELVNQMDDRNGFGAGRGRGRGGGPGMGFRGGGMPPRGGGMGMMGGRGGGRGGGAGWPNRSDNGGGGEKMEYVTVPSNKVGLVIGKGGETIKSINQASGAFVEIDKRAPPEAQEKNFIIRGPPENVDKAKQMVLEKVREFGALLNFEHSPCFFFTHVPIVCPK
jgi:far upstream element-binding protein